MRRRSLPWVFAVPLSVAGTVAAHLMGAALVSSGGAAGAAGAAEDADHSVEHVVRTTHMAGSLAPMAIGLVLAFSLVWLARRAVGTRRHRAFAAAGIGWFFLLPPIALLAQETAERLIRSESFPFNPAHEPGLLAALALQIPFGIAVVIIARALRSFAERMRYALAGRSAIPFGSSPPALEPARRGALRRQLAALAAGCSSRSPPALA